METTTIITVYINKKPYDFHVNIDHKSGVTTYYVSSEKKTLPEDIPDELVFNVDGEVNQEERLLNARQVKIAQLVWKELLNKLKP